MHAIIAIYMSE